MTGRHLGGSRRIRTTAALAAAAMALAGGVATSTTSWAGSAPSGTAQPERAARTAGPSEARGFFDLRHGTTDRAHAAELRAATKASSRPAARALQRSLSDHALLEYDGSTGTVRILEDLDGFLTGRSSKAPAKVAMGYVRANHDALGLTSDDLDTFRLRRDYRDIEGVHHLSWSQRVGGERIFGNGLQAAVTRGGRLLMLGGSPVSGASAPTTAGSSRLGTPAAAIAAARRDLGESSTAAGPRDTAEPVLFVTRTGTHRAWQSITMSAEHPAVSVLDAETGALLYRRPLSAERAAAEGSSGKAVTYFPGHRPGGKPQKFDYTKRGWLGPKAKRLFGNNSHAYSDVNDDNHPQRGEEAPPSNGHRWNYVLKPFHLKKVSFCDNPYPCSWNPNKPYSWRTNRKQNVAQVFFFVNNWHDHLLRAPIGFTEAAGNFQRKNFGRHGEDGDFVDTQTDDGANTDHGLPDGAHIDNANMDTPPDGMAPTMQMYLQHQPGTSYPDGDPFAPTNVGDEADTVYHEYTHGLSNRLVVDPNGVSTLGGVQAGAMGEAWSDWYAMDYLVAKGLQKDNPDKVDVVLFQYDGAGVALDRTEPIDCAVGSTAKRCNGGATGHGGGYTYADYAQVIGSPEVHSDGEIWAQTLWDLRNRLGSRRSEALVTRAMELAPTNPSFLDMRNAILVADTALFGGDHHRGIWSVFAHRGMGFYAGSLGGDDSAPAASTDLPPTSPATGTISGVVRDQDSGQPVAGVPVTLAFQGGGGIANPTAITADDGSYSLGPVPVGHYGKLVVSGAGYDTTQHEVTVTAGGTTEDFGVRRDWAAASGGASVADFNGPDFSPFGCGPDRAIDNSQATGWSTTTGADEAPTNVFVPKHVTVDLGRQVDISEFGVDPANTCGDGGSASTGDYRIETSPDNATWTTASTGTFTVDDRGRINLLSPTAGASGVRYVKFTILGNQTPDFATSCPDGAFSGCTYTDLTELEVYGEAAP
ncbi:M36 family metallopeptidase [Nocardioides sp. MAHUQ-72]|uniref:M36 family metallopeptidase n=1 Tax=unclassified Nocardioides TaxID=2615069 RepID=UPI00361F5715